MANDEQQRVKKDTKAFSFPSPREEEVHRKILRLLGYGPADFFLDACNIVGNNGGLRTVTHLVFHLLRELESSMRDILEPLSTLATKIDPKARHIGEIRIILQALEIPESDELAQAWLKIATKLSGKAHRDGLGPVQPPTQEFEQNWQQVVRILNAVLDRFEAKFVAVHGVLDKLLLHEVPSDEDLETLKNRIPHNAAAFDYFFDKLQSPSWLAPLEKQGFFARLPEPTISGTHYPCPQTRYLVRMAARSESQSAVLSIALGMTTDNALARLNLVEAAIALPPSLAVKLVPKFMGYVDTRYPHLLPFRLGELVTRLAQEGFPREALDLMTILLTIDPSVDSSRNTWDDPKTRIDSLEYTSLLEKSVPAIAESISVPILELLCNLLAFSLDQTRRPDEDYNDGSYIWRYSLNGHEVHSSREITNGLITAIYDVGLKLLEKDPSGITHLVEILDSKRWTIFQRLGMHFLASIEDPPRELVARKLLDENLWDNRTAQREYNTLAELHGSLLTTTEIRQLTDRIEPGPDWLERTDLPEDQTKRHLRLWKRDRLAPFRDVLPVGWQKVCDELLEEEGEPVDEPAIKSATSVGSISPITADQLGSMTIPEMIDYMRKWKSTEGWQEPDPEGLGGTLKQLVIEDPMSFATSADLFVDLDPTYVRSLLAGLGEAAKAEQVFPWEKVLSLCEWVLKQPIVIPGRKKSRLFDADPDWSWTRGRIVDLVTKGLIDNKAAIPFSMRGKVWSLIAALTDDPNPTPEHEQEYGGKNMNPYELAINTVRGDAMEAVIFYISWILRNLKVTAGSEKRIDGGMQHVPEAAAVLEAHLDLKRDPSLAIRSVYGKWLANLDYTDHEWTVRMLPSILPHDPALKQFRNAAWDACLLYSGGPYNKTAEMLIPEYRFAVDNISQMTDVGRADPRTALAHDIGILYLRGILKLDGDDGVITAFFRLAGSSLCGKLVEGVGEFVRHNKKPSVEWIDRAKRFWGQRVSLAESATDAKPYIEEMESFGYWFMSEKFDDDWSLRNLERALTISRDIDFDYAVVKRLAVLTSKNPLECIRCLQLIVTGKDKAGWGVRGYLKEAQAVLATVFAGSNEKAKKIAREVISALLVRGHQEFRNTENGS